MPELDAAKTDAGAFIGSASEDTDWTLTLTGKGNYTGTRTIRYTIYGTTAAESGVRRALMSAVEIPAIPAQVTFRGIGTYGGRRTENFKIGARGLVEGIWLGAVVR